MKKTLFTLLLANCFLLTVNATIRRVGFTASTSPVFGIDFADLQTAHNAAVAGDTIQIYPNTTPTSYSATLNKRLVILGPGYFYNSYNAASDLNNAGLQNLAGGINNVSITIGVGSSGTLLAGHNQLYVTTSNVPDSLNNISIIRSRNVNVYWDNSGVCNNWLISQCTVINTNQTAYGASFIGNRTITNFRVENCLEGIGIRLNSSPVGISSGHILNCTGLQGNFALHPNNQSIVVQNCIVESSSMSGVANTIFINNITSSASSNNPVFTNPGSSGNVFGVSFANNAFFLGYPNNASGSTTLNSPDTRYQLSATSPAKNAGIIPGTATPTDCGAFGGTNPYKASGIPAVPAFYRLNAASSSATTGPYTLTFSVRSNN